MIRIQYDPALIEQATFLAARRDKSLERELHAAIDPLYEIRDEEQRRRAFENAYRALFAKLRLDKPVTDLIAERALIDRHVGECVVRGATRRKDESAELFVVDTGAKTTPADRTLVIQICPESLLDGDRLASRLKRELLHVSDMLDERFAYKKETIAPDTPRSRQNLIRDRYRVLWDVYVEGRLSREGANDEGTMQRLQRMFSRVFADCDVDWCTQTFRRVFDAPAVTHPTLLAFAHAPKTHGLQSAGVSEAPGGRTTGTGQTPGEQCPLCGFPTHDWFEFDGDAGYTVAERVQAAYPQWSRERGACRQCAEMYAS